MPGFAIDAEVTPLQNVPSFGLGVTSAFFRTKQTTIVPIANDMNGGSDAESKLLRAVIANCSPGSSPKIPAMLAELTGGLRTRMLKFSIDGDSDYKGVSYLTLDFELDSFMPIATKQLGLVRGSISPVVSFGTRSRNWAAPTQPLGFRRLRDLHFGPKVALV